MAHSDEQESLADLIRKHQMTPYADGKGGWLFRAASAREIAECVTESEWLSERLAEAWERGFMDAAAQDHPTYPRKRRMTNPYQGEEGR